MSIGKKIQNLRKQNGITQEELGQRLGISGKSVSKWEVELTLPDTSMITRICDVFGICTDELLRDDVVYSKSNNKTTILNIRTINGNININ